MSRQSSRSKEIATANPTPPVEVINPAKDAGALMALIIRAASDPTVDAAKVEQLTKLHAEIEDRNARRAAEEAYFVAMAAAQAELKTVAANSKNDQTHSNYADIEAVDRAIRPVAAKYGLALMFATGKADGPDQIRILLTVAKGLHRETIWIDIPNDGKGARGGDVMTKTHAQVAATTYGQRTLLRLAFNVAVSKDMDGNLVEQEEVITEAQFQHLVKFCDEVEADKAKFCDLLKVPSLAEIPQRLYGIAVKKLEQKRIARDKKAAKKDAAK